VSTPVTVLEGCTVVTMDGQGSEYASGHVIVTGNVITAVGPGSPPPGSLAGPGSTGAGGTDSDGAGTVRRIEQTPKSKSRAETVATRGVPPTMIARSPSESESGGFRI